MADRRLPLLRGSITALDTFEGPRGGPRPRIPALVPAAHRARLVEQLDAIVREVEARPPADRDPDAVREVIAIRPAPDADLSPDAFRNVKADAELVGTVRETGTVLIDVPGPELSFLRDKVDEFADDSKVKTNEKTGKTRRAHERAIAPIGSIGLATLDDIRGPRLRKAVLAPDRPYWFEVTCPGGYRRPAEVTRASRALVLRQIHRLGVLQDVDELVGPEHVYFFVRLKEEQLRPLVSATGCIYEVELAPPPLRDLKLLEGVATRDVRAFKMDPPPARAPSVVILDTGISTGHPLLRNALLPSVTAGPEIPSVEDTYGHGTKMAGIALHPDLGASIEDGEAQAAHWLQSSRLLVQPEKGTAAPENYENWPGLTIRAVRAAEEKDPGRTRRVFTLAVTRSMQEPPFDACLPTLWSQAVDQLSYAEGAGRLVVVSAGNARQDHWLRLAEQYPDLQLSEKIHEPAQAANALTVGAFTNRVELPHTMDPANRVVAPRPGGISPYTSTGPVGPEWPAKPDIVMEGGNLAISGPLPNASVPTLSALTTSQRHVLGEPLGLLSMTSEAAARAARLAARIWTVEEELRPESVRALLVHSATWTPTMVDQFPGIDDRLRACGYGVPAEAVATSCAAGLATVVIEGTMPNAVDEEVPRKVPPKRSTTSPTEVKRCRKVLLYRLPIPVELANVDDPEVELRVTLSYFAEPNKYGSTAFRGLDLKWDMQGPTESETEFLERINLLRRPRGPDGKPLKATTKGFKWDVGIQLRSRGTVQSDRWTGKMSSLAGNKLIAVLPVLGWWERRTQLKDQSMPFSLVASVFGPGVYAAIRPHVEAAAAMPAAAVVVDV